MVSRDESNPLSLRINDGKTVLWPGGYVRYAPPGGEVQDIKVVDSQPDDLGRVLVEVVDDHGRHEERVEGRYLSNCSAAR